MLFLKLLYTQFLAAVLLFVAINPNVEAAPKVRVLLKPTIDIAYEDSILRPLMDAWTLTSGIEVTLDWAQSLVTNDYGKWARILRLSYLRLTF
ncbi:hypothetical protein DFS34DRAFT_496114 [Phlyctochytrium arcticum]|nr:hypothetical protein DFS34DRAFT_496114 [Phlyctochytrium arcticum]